MAESLEVGTDLLLPDVGERLRAAREAAGLSRTDIAARTKIPERHLASIEAGKFAALSGRSYALGFSRSYARAVGLDEQEISAAVRNELDSLETDDERRPATAFEPGDPSRVPSGRTAWLAALGALAVVLAGFAFWSSFYVPAVELPSLVTKEAAAPPPLAAAVNPTPQPAVTAQGPVTFTALEDGIWVKFYDAAGEQLMQKQMTVGESYTVPAEADRPLLWTGRPEALRITIGGKEVLPLSDRQITMKDVPVSAAALLARAAPPAPSAAAAITEPLRSTHSQKRETVFPRQVAPAAGPSGLPPEEAPATVGYAASGEASTVSE